MEHERQNAVIDADFFIKLTQYDDKRATLFRQLMEDLNIQPIMHAYVARTEIKSFPAIKELIQEGLIIVYDYSDYIDDQNREDYKDYFEDAFEQMNLYEFPDGEDIYTYDCEDESLGEIRSVYLAKTLKCLYFMSDDGNARRLAKRHSVGKHQIVAWDIYTALTECKQRGTHITLKLLNPTIHNVFRDRQKMLHELQRLYRQ